MLYLKLNSNVFIMIHLYIVIIFYLIHKLSFLILFSLISYLKYYEIILTKFIFKTEKLSSNIPESMDVSYKK